MKSTLGLLVAVAGSFLLGGCLNSDDASVLGNTAGAVGGTIASYAGVGYVGSSAIHYGSQGVTAMAVSVMRRHEASEEQRRLAEARAEAYLAGLKEAERRQVQKRRYLAVETKRNSQSTGRRSVMVFDTKNDRLVGNEVLDINSAPDTGSTAKFDTVNTTYVGA